MQPENLRITHVFLMSPIVVVVIVCQHPIIDEKMVIALPVQYVLDRNRFKATYFEGEVQNMRKECKHILTDGNIMRTEYKGETRTERKVQQTPTGIRIR